LPNPCDVKTAICCLSQRHFCGYRKNKKEGKEKENWLHRTQAQFFFALIILTEVGSIHDMDCIICLGVARAGTLQVRLIDSFTR